MAEGSSPVMVALIAAIASVATAGLGVYATKRDLADKIAVMEAKTASDAKTIADVTKSRDELKNQLAATGNDPAKIDMSFASLSSTIESSNCLNLMKTHFDENASEALAEGGGVVDFSLNGDRASIWCDSDRVIISTASLKGTAGATRHAAFSLADDVITAATSKNSSDEMEGKTTTQQ